MANLGEWNSRFVCEQKKISDKENAKGTEESSRKYKKCVYNAYNVLCINIICIIMLYILYDLNTLSRPVFLSFTFSSYRFPFFFGVALQGEKTVFGCSIKGPRRMVDFC